LFVPGGFAAGNRGADFVQHLAPALAPEQGAGPDTVNRTIKLRLLVRPPVPVSTAIRRHTSDADNFLVASIITTF